MKEVKYEGKPPERANAGVETYSLSGVTIQGYTAFIKRPAAKDWSPAWDDMIMAIEEDH